MRQIDVRTLHGALSAPDADAHVVDVRERHEYATGHVPGAVNVPMTEIVARVDEVTSLDGPVYLVCQSGNRSGQVTDWLTQQGYDVVNVDGGTSAWRSAGLPVE